VHKYPTIAAVTAPMIRNFGSVFPDNMNHMTKAVIANPIRFLTKGILPSLLLRKGTNPAIPHFCLAA
jgi:hypothetical protein